MNQSKNQTAGTYESKIRQLQQSLSELQKNSDTNLANHEAFQHLYDQVSSSGNRSGPLVNSLIIKLQEEKDHTINQMMRTVQRQSQKIKNLYLEKNILKDDYELLRLNYTELQAVHCEQLAQNMRNIKKPKPETQILTTNAQVQTVVTSEQKHRQSQRNSQKSRPSGSFNQKTVLEKSDQLYVILHFFNKDHFQKLYPQLQGKAQCLSLDEFTSIYSEVQKLEFNADHVSQTLQDQLQNLKQQTEKLKACVNQYSEIIDKYRSEQQQHNSKIELLEKELNELKQQAINYNKQREKVEQLQAIINRNKISLSQNKEMTEKKQKQIQQKLFQNQKELERQQKLYEQKIQKLQTKLNEYQKQKKQTAQTPRFNKKYEEIVTQKQREIEILKQQFNKQLDILKQKNKQLEKEKSEFQHTIANVQSIQEKNIKEKEQLILKLKAQIIKKDQTNFQINGQYLTKIKELESNLAECEKKNNNEIQIKENKINEINKRLTAEQDKLFAQISKRQEIISQLHKVIDQNKLRLENQRNDREKQRKGFKDNIEKQYQQSQTQINQYQKKNKMLEEKFQTLSKQKGDASSTRKQQINMVNSEQIQKLRAENSILIQKNAELTSTLQSEKSSKDSELNYLKQTYVQTSQAYESSIKEFQQRVLSDQNLIFQQRQQMGKLMFQKDQVSKQLKDLMKELESKEPSNDSKNDSETQNERRAKAALLIRR